MQIQIHNIRLGFACNSSSTHSAVFLSPSTLAQVGDDWSGYGQYDFGWDHWTAASADSKRRYLALTIYDSLRRTVSEDIARLISSEWAGIQGPFHTDYHHGYIDHQSMLEIPQAWTGKGS